MHGFHIAFFGSSLVSAYWNGAATYYRGLLRALHARGHQVTFYEPDAYGRQQHRDIEDPQWARVIVYRPDASGVEAAMLAARDADIVVKASGVGVNDEWLEREILRLQRPGRIVAFWDVDAPATLARLEQLPDDPFRALIPRYDLVFTYGGGAPVVGAYSRRGARACVPIYNAVDPDTHHPVSPDVRFAGTLNFLGNRLPDREARVREFFLKPAAMLSGRRFCLGGSGWDGSAQASANVHVIGHVYSHEHNAFNCSAMAVLNVNRESMARTGYSPATRIFESAGAGACIISDAWQGIEEFLEPEREVLLASNGDEVLHHVQRLGRRSAAAIGTAARRRVLARHTYAHRAAQVEQVLQGRVRPEAAA